MMTQLIYSRLSNSSPLCIGKLLCLCIFALLPLWPTEALTEQPPDPPTSTSPKDLLLTERTVLTWLECEECTAEQLNAVIRLGPPALPFLKSGLSVGPSDDRRKQLTLHLRHEYKNLLDYRASHRDSTIPLSENQYVNAHAVNLTNQYGTRSATALGAIGGPIAKAILQKSQQEELTEVVRDAVQQALKLIISPKQPSERPSHQAN